MRHISRRTFLDLAATLAGATLVGCQHDPSSSHASGGSGGNSGAGSGGGSDGGTGPAGTYPVGIAAYEQAGLRAAAVRSAVELAGGTPWLKSGDTVLIKVAHNSINPYPATSSPVACAEMVKILLEAGAKKVVIADLMGIDNTLVPGGWAIEDPFGQIFGGDNDATIRAFKHSGLFQAVVAAVGAANVGPDRPVHITSFREHGWSRYESSGDTKGAPFLRSSWVKDQLEMAERWDHAPSVWNYVPRAFDLLKDDVPGMYVPNLFSEVDHVVNLHRMSTHVMSHYTLALKSWIGIMRPDDRIWMHQLGYLLNHRGTGDDPIRTEPPYNELLAELHASTVGKERLALADASLVIASGGPDASDQALFPAQLVVAANDLVSADVVGLSILRMAVMASKLQGGLGGKCSPPPQSEVGLSLSVVGGAVLPWHPATLRGTDAKLCDPTFSHWDWVAVQRARELQMGCPSPADLALRFPQGGDHALPDAQKQWLLHDAFLPPKSK